MNCIGSAVPCIIFLFIYFRTAILNIWTYKFIFLFTSHKKTVFHRYLATKSDWQNIDYIFCLLRCQSNSNSNSNDNLICTILDSKQNIIAIVNKDINTNDSVGKIMSIYYYIMIIFLIFLNKNHDSIIIQNLWIWYENIF